MDQKLIIEANEIQQKSQELSQNLEFIDSQLSELSDFILTVESISKSEDNSTLTTLGKGVYIKSALMEKDFYVDVGVGVIIKKSSSQTLDIIYSQIDKLKSARTSILSELDSLQNRFAEVLQIIQSKDN